MRNICVKSVIDRITDLVDPMDSREPNPFSIMQLDEHHNPKKKDSDSKGIKNLKNSYMDSIQSHVALTAHSSVEDVQYTSSRTPSWMLE